MLVKKNKKGRFDISILIFQTWDPKSHKNQESRIKNQESRTKNQERSCFNCAGFDYDYEHKHEHDQYE